MAKFGAKKTGSRAARATSSTSAVSQPLVPTMHGTPAVSARSTFGTTAAGAVKSIIASASASSTTSSCPASTSAGPRTAPTLPISGEGGLWPCRRIFIRSSSSSVHGWRRRRTPERSSRVLKSAPASGASSRARERRRDLFERLEEPLFVRADPCRREAVGREQRRGELGDELGLDCFDLGNDAIEGEDLRVGHERLA